VLDVPLSVAAFSEKMLDTKGVKTIADLSRIVPSLTFTPSWAGSSTISIRGISSSIGAGTTGVYIDDTPIQVRALGAGATSTNAYPAIFDLARVEVLRGPQGTLFGAGSEGGTVRFISPDPGFTEYTGYGRAEIATTESGAPSYEAGAAIGGPLIDDRVAFRLSAFHRRDGGWVDRAPYPGDVITQRNTNSVDTTVLRGALAIKVADNFKLTPSVYYQDIKRNDSFQYWRGLSDPAHQRFLNGQPLKQPGKDRFELYSLKGEYDLPGINIISNTSFFIRHNPSVADYSHYVSELIGGDYNNSLDVGVIAPATMRNDQHVFTQELRIQSDSGKNARLNWVLGFFYQNARQRADESVAVSDLNALSQALFGLTPTEAFGQDNLPGNVSYFGKDTARDRQIALFGQVDYKILSSLTLTLGARVARTRFNFTNSQGGPFNGGPTGSSGNMPRRRLLRRSV
jgi:outer membrane receptor protein involved in Fe transport